MREAHRIPPAVSLAFTGIVLLATTLSACTAQATDAPGSLASGDDQRTATMVQATDAPGASDRAQSGTPFATQDDAPVGSAATATALVEARLPRLDEIIGIGGVGPADIMLPVDVAVDDDGFYFLADVTGVRRLNPDGSEATRIGTEEIITTQGGLALSPDGRLYVTGFGPTVWVFDAADGTLLSTIGEEGPGPGQLSLPVDVAVDGEGAVYVADAANARIEKYGPDGVHLMSIGDRGVGRGLFTTPRAVAVDNDGRVYVGLGDDYLVQRFAPDGTYIDAFGQAHGDENAWRVGGIAIDDAGNVYVTQALSGRIQRFLAPEMHLDWELGSPGKDRASLSSPLGAVVAGDRLIVADQGNNRVKVYTLTP